MDLMESTERVEAVIDGDTFRISDHKDLVRLEGVDAPEIDAPDGEWAKYMLESLINKKEVSIETKARDAFGRRIAQVKVGSRSVNEAMIDLLQKLADI